MVPAKPYFFEEGQEYVFVVSNRIQLPPDDENFFILISAFNTKHLLPEKNYLNYNIVPGQRLKCRIDKINCSGKIFLEPEHPVYKEKEIYEFPVKGMETILNSEGKQELMILVDDCWHNDIFINASTVETGKLKTIKCQVDRIKKGKLYLHPVTKKQFSSTYDIGKQYEFTVDSIVTLAEDEEYYVLKDAPGNVHYLRKKYFKDYNFDIGAVISCRVTAQPALFRHYLEPVHPHYKIGEVYDFLYSGTESYINESGEEVKKILVSDGSEKDFFVTCDYFSDLHTEPGSTVRCLLRNIKMGRLVLECV
ncbi:MAG TPA: hypothetical protein PKI01_10720 [Bacteroidales bacterium]|mgnify:CR=1 FL=1|nr:hypothetical protein [Bacteroidales bacterium]